MEPERWKQVEQLCPAALGRDVGLRDAFLREAGEDSLRREAEILLGYAKGTHGLNVSRHVRFLPHNRADPSSERSLAVRPAQPV